VELMQKYSPQLETCFSCATFDSQAHTDDMLIALKSFGISVPGGSVAKRDSLPKQYTAKSFSSRYPKTSLTLDVSTAWTIFTL